MTKCFPLHLTAIAALFVMITSLGWPGPALAVDLQGAKAQGLVGEQPDGYLGSVESGPSADVAALISDINAKRKKHYQGIASRNNTSLEAVEALAGKKAIEKTAAGQFVKLPSGEWKRK